MLNYESIKDNLENSMALLCDLNEVTGSDIKEAYSLLSKIETELENNNTPHIAPLKEVFEQFDSYKSNCSDCNCFCDIGHLSLDDICGDHGLICRKKLMEAAEELDG